MNRIINHISLLIIFMLMGGCASSPTASGYLADYNRLQPGTHLEKYWSDNNEIQIVNSTSIVIGDINVDSIADQKGVTAKDSASWLRSALERKKVISGRNTNAPIRLDLAITYMDPGSAAARMWAGELGAGHAQVQVEGKVVDIKNGDVLATFAERRRSSGAFGLKDIGGDSGPGLVREMIQQIADDIYKELLAEFSSVN